MFADPKAVAKSLGLVSLLVGPIAFILLTLGRNAYLAFLRDSGQPDAA